MKEIVEHYKVTYSENDTNIGIKKSSGREIKSGFKYKLMHTVLSPGQLYCLTSLVLKMYIIYIYKYCICDYVDLNKC